MKLSRQRKPLRSRLRLLFLPIAFVLFLVGWAFIVFGDQPKPKKKVNVVEEMDRQERREILERGD